MKQPENMSFKELLTVERKLNKFIPIVREREKADLRQKMEAVAAEHGLRLRDVLEKRP